MNFCLRLQVFSYTLKLLHSLFLLSLLSTTYLHAVDQYDIRKRIEYNLMHLYLDQAEIETSKLDNKAYQAYYRANILVYRFLSTYSTSYHEKLSKNWSETIHIIEELPTIDPMRNILLAELYCKRAALEFFERNYFTAIRYLQNGRNLIRKNEENFPDKIEHKKIQGLFNVAFGAVPRKYQWLSNFMGFKGDISTGIEELKKAAKYASLLPMEGEIMVYYVSKNMQNLPYKAMERLKLLKQKMNNNILLDVCLASGYLSVKENEAALEILQRRDFYLSDKRVFFVPLWDYLLGKAYYFKQNYHLAQVYFSQFLQSENGMLFRTDAMFRLGMAYTLNDNYHRGREIFSQLISDKNSGFEDDAYAAQMAQKFFVSEPSINVKALFKARNRYDGGYYGKALEILSSLSTQHLNLQEKTELHYRYARIYHTQGKLDLANFHYQHCIAQPKSSQLWLQVYAYYFSGEIAKEQQLTEKAKELYKKALSFDDYFYQDGLENRCKVALDELNKKK